jgi:hypothetical protein
MSIVLVSHILTLEVQAGEESASTLGAHFSTKCLCQGDLRLTRSETRSGDER